MIETRHLKNVVIFIQQEKFLQMLEKEAFFAKFRTIILNIAEIQKSVVEKLTSDVLIFKIVLKD